MLFALGFGGALRVASARECVQPVVVGENDGKTVYYKREESSQSSMSTSLYLKPGSDFEDVCVKAKSEWEMKVFEVCFPAEEIHLSNSTWNLLGVKVEITGWFSYKLKFILMVNGNARETAVGTLRT